METDDPSDAATGTSTRQSAAGKSAKVNNN